MKEKPFNNPFASLQSLREGLPEGPKPPKESSKKTQTPIVEKLSTEETSIHPSIETAALVEKSEESYIETAEEIEDEKLIKEVVVILDSMKGTSPLKRGSEKWYGGIRDALSGSRTRDTSYNLHRWIGSWIRSIEDPDASKRLEEITTLLLQRAHESGAKVWLESATTKGMQYGKSTREERIDQARESAKNAGMTLEEIIEKYSIPIKL